MSVNADVFFFTDGLLVPCYAMTQDVFLFLAAGNFALDVIRNLNYIMFHNKSNSELISSVSI